MRTVIGIPAHDGRTIIETADLLLKCRDLFDGVIWLKSCCFPSQARNAIAHQFLNGDADRLLFIDTDIVFTRDAMSKLLEIDKEVVAGLYCARTMGDHRVFVHPLGEKIERGLNECTAVATGFMLIQRGAFEKIKAHRKDAWFWGGKDDKEKVWDFFPCGRVCEPHRWSSDDFSFCHMARESGVSVWVDTDIRVGHMGQVVFGVQ
jgi:hypothetical protein